MTCSICSDPSMIVTRDEPSEKQLCVVCWAALARVHEAGTKEGIFTSPAIWPWVGWAPHVTRNRLDKEVDLEWIGSGGRGLLLTVTENGKGPIEWLCSWGPGASEMKDGELDEEGKQLGRLWNWLHGEGEL